MKAYAFSRRIGTVETRLEIESQDVNAHFTKKLTIFLNLFTICSLFK